MYVESVLRGHQIYKSIWNPIIGEDLDACRELESVHDRRAVSIKKSGAIVGHVPREISRVLGRFISHCGNVSCRGRRKLGHGLEVPCTYILAGKKKLLAKIQIQNYLTVKHIAYTCM